VRSADKLVERIVTVLKEHPEGLRTHDLRNAVRAAQSDYARAIATAGNLLVKKGNKRGTVYMLAGTPATVGQSAQAASTAA
jgi:hypothetical protein